MNQNLSLYRIFYTVALTGNISHAADELFISQPAVSKSIRKLEQSMNTALFTRSSRGVQLTRRRGTAFLPCKISLPDPGECGKSAASPSGAGHRGSCASEPAQPSVNMC